MDVNVVTAPVQPQFLAAASGGDKARLNQAAQEFEAMVIAQLLAPLFKSVETPGLAGGGPGEEAYAGLLQEEYAKQIAARGGFGIADQIKAALIELQAEKTNLTGFEGDTK